MTKTHEVSNRAEDERKDVVQRKSWRKDEPDFHVKADPDDDIPVGPYFVKDENDSSWINRLLKKLIHSLPCIPAEIRHGFVLFLLLVLYSMFFDMDVLNFISIKPVTAED